MDMRSFFVKTRAPVEMTSEFAINEVLSPMKAPAGKKSQGVPLQSYDLLRDGDDAHSEAQAFPCDWLGSKLQLEVYMEDNDLICTSESPATEHTALNFSNFDDLYKHLTKEDDHDNVHSFLQDLMEQEVIKCGMIEELALDVGQTRRKFRDPICTMEARHQQVRENRIRRDAEKQRQQRKREAQQVAAAEARRREQEQKRQEALRQEKLVQQEMVKLRRQMEERKCLRHVLQQRGQERTAEQGAARSLQSAPQQETQQQQQQQQQQQPITEKLHKEQAIHNNIKMHNLKCLQRHFSTWYSVVLDRRLRGGKAMALYDWKRQLRAWRGWRAVLWTEKKQREMERTEEELRSEKKQEQRQNLWCRMERDKREILTQQQETRCKMAALISAASAGRLTEPPAGQPNTAAAVESNHPQTKKEAPQKSGTSASDASTARHKNAPVDKVSQPTQPWQVNHRHVAPTPAELHAAKQKAAGGGFTCSKSTCSEYEDRHAIQQQIITQQRQLLKMQQDQIAQLKEQQNMTGLQPPTQNAPQCTIPSASESESCTFDPAQQRAPTVPGEPDSLCTPCRKPVTRPIITGMEARARQRADRKKEIEELKRKKEEMKLAEMKAAEEQRQREEEEEKRQAVQKRKEEKRQERMREEEKQRQMKKQLVQVKLAKHHYRRSLLQHRGLVPWKRLIQQSHANAQLAESHHNLFLLRRCTLGWQQSARESLSEKRAAADQLHRQFLLRSSLSCWKRLMDWRAIQVERAKCFYRTCTLRRFLLALSDHVTLARLVECDRLELAEKHNDRQVLLRCLQAWRQFPNLQRKEQEREVRRERLGRRVTEVLPDFGSWKFNSFHTNIPK